MLFSFTYGSGLLPRVYASEKTLVDLRDNGLQTETVSLLRVATSEIVAVRSSHTITYSY